MDNNNNKYDHILCLIVAHRTLILFLTILLFDK